MFSTRVAPLPKKASLWKRAKFLISVMYNYVRREHHHAIIENETHDGQKLGNIYLGAMPMKQVGRKKTNHHLPIIRKASESDRPLRLVVGVVEKFELKRKSTYILQPVKPKDWRREHKVNFHNVEIPDFSMNVEYEKILAAVLDISMTRQSGYSVFLHCKAGRSRSVLVLMCYLMTEYKNPETGQPLNFKEAYDKIKSKRSHIDFDKDHKRIAVENFVNNYFIQKTEEQERIINAYNTSSIAIRIPQKTSAVQSSPQTYYVRQLETPPESWYVRKNHEQQHSPLFSFGRSVVDFFSPSSSPKEENLSRTVKRRAVLHH